MADIAALGVSIKQTGVLETERALDGVVRAAGAADRATGKLRDASGRFVRSGTQVAGAADAAADQMDQFTAATLRANAALNDTPNIANRYGTAMNGAGGATANVFAQLNDIGVMMAAGQNPIQLALQQGMQLNQVWGSMGNNVGGILRTLGGAFMSLLNPINLVTIGVIAGGAALVQWAFSADDSAERTVTFGDKALATFQVIGRGIWDYIEPAATAIGGWFWDAWRAVADGTRWVGNVLINGVTVAVDGVGAVVSTIPAMFAAGFEGAKVAVFDALSSIMAGVNSMLSGIANGLNSVFGTNLAAPSGMLNLEADMMRMSNDAFIAQGQASGQIASALSGFSDRAAATMNNDPMGQFFDAISTYSRIRSRSSVNAPS